MTREAKVKNVLWAILFVLVLLVASHLEYKQIQEEDEALKQNREIELEEQFYEYHY